MTNIRHHTGISAAADVQASRPAVHLSLSKAGVTGVHQVIRICHGGDETVYYADIECSVDLDPAQKGVHMSRFAELFAEAIESVVLGEALAIEDLAGQIATRVLERQGSLRSYARIEAKYPVSRVTPVSGLTSQEIYTLIGVASATTSGTRRAVGVRVRGLNACPCAQGMVRERASERLSDMGYDAEERERILDAIPIATHNQRAEAELLVGSSRFTPAEELVEIAESSMSAPILALLKRPDELYVVEQAHLHPMFVEDSVRAMVQGVIERYPALEDDALVAARQVNFETIRNHDVVAERTGLLGDLRDEVLRGRRGGEHLTLDAWLALA
jgi:GTP cyclohydrolase-4